MIRWALLLTLVAGHAAAEIPREAVCRVIVTMEDGGRSHGSGTLVKRQGDAGLVVTCHHVTDGGTSFVCQFGEAERGAALVGSDKSSDLAALLIVEPPAIAAKRGTAGNRATIAGYPGGEGLLVVSGGRRGYYTLASGCRTVAFAAPVKRGASGGGVFNDRDEWCGVVWGTLPNESFTVVGDRALRFVDRFSLRAE